ncbi:hypothetical protein SKA34_09503 [Photobacterium sp. SKA34]|uniref:hypothetical protein n=1 Tax=Photobacterium sp. SKA34 TaxID=121723 RepID=UPI00006AF7EC|nr:hypothetical protein [Photobacterium sp. SKA34]EAR54945.1 hypothetical protein SKA34_09503 [Photobacterium sp. SKA34]
MKKLCLFVLISTILVGCGGGGGDSGGGSNTKATPLDLGNLTSDVKKQYAQVNYDTFLVITESALNCAKDLKVGETDNTCAVIDSGNHNEGLSIEDISGTLSVQKQSDKIQISTVKDIQFHAPLINQNTNNFKLNQNNIANKKEETNFITIPETNTQEMADSETESNSVFLCGTFTFTNDDGIKTVDAFEHEYRGLIYSHNTNTDESHFFESSSRMVGKNNTMFDWNTDDNGVIKPI